MLPRWLPAILLICLLLATPGCWDRSDPELLAIVLAVAFDLDEKNELYQVIAQVVDPVAMGGAQSGDGGGGGGGGAAFWTVAASGRTPIEALQNQAGVSSRQLFWAHSRVLLLSERLARRGIGEVLDLIERERQFRPIMSVVVVEGDLKGLMKAEFPLEETGGRGIDRMLITTRSDTSIYVLKQVSEIYNTLSQPGIELLVGKMAVLREGLPAQGGGDSSAQDQGGKGGSAGKISPVQIGGAAIFKGDRLVGWGDTNHARGWNYATAMGKRFSFVIDCPMHSGGNLLSIQNYAVKSRMRPLVSGSDLGATITVQVEGRLEEISCPYEHDLGVHGDFIKRVEHACAQSVRSRILELLKLSRELNADVLGFGNLFYRKQPRLWKEIEASWDEIYPTLDVTVEVEYNLTRAGMVADQIKER